MNIENKNTRQNFIQNSKKGAVLTASLVASHSAFSDSKDKILKVGLIGCGARGSGAVINALLADPKVELVAMADLFEDKLIIALEHLQKNKIVGGRVRVASTQQFVGFDAHEKLLKTDVDIVILATPPAFRPLQLKAAIGANKHVFAEKPIAVDAFGVQMAKSACEEAKKKKLFVVAGLQTRYEPNTQKMVKMIQEGAIGDVVSLSTVRYQGALKVKHYPKIESEVAKQIGNWLNFTWLSGDTVVELFVHELDRLSWLLKEDPISCYATGGRQQPRSKSVPGQNFDHFSATIVYPKGVMMNVSVRQQAGTDNIWTMDVGGTQGHCHGKRRDFYKFSGKTNKELVQAKDKDGYQLEQDEMYRALRAGDYINNGEYLCKATLLGIMIREAAYSGKEIKWADILSSKAQLFDVSTLTFETKLPEWKEAVPGMNGII